MRSGKLLLHVTDAHLFADAQGLLKGICSLDSYHAVLELAAEQLSEPDVIIMGGDMAQDESAMAYLRAADALTRWSVPVMISPGNHADLPTLRQVLIPALNAHSSCCDVLDMGEWRVITISTHSPGQVPGLIDELEMQRLHALLCDSEERFVLIALHHPPVVIGSLWMDSIGLQNRDALWGMIARFPQVKVLLCGHIHQQLDTVHRGVRVLGTPATSVQFTPQADDFELDNQSPGYRWIRLLEDGDIETGVSRVSGFVPPDLYNDDPY